MSNVKKTQTSSVVFDINIYEMLCLNAGKYGQSHAKHINVILAYVLSKPKKEIDEIVEKGLVQLSKKKWS